MADSEGSDPRQTEADDAAKDAPGSAYVREQRETGNPGQFSEFAHDSATPSATEPMKPEHAGTRPPSDAHRDPGELERADGEQAHLDSDVAETSEGQPGSG